MEAWCVFLSPFYGAQPNTPFSLCTVCLNQILTGNTLDLQDTQVLREQRLPACHRLQVALPGLPDWVWAQLANQVPQIPTQLPGKRRDSGLQVIRALIIRITGVVSLSTFYLGAISDVTLRCRILWTTAGRPARCGGRSAPGCCLKCMKKSFLNLS